MLTVKGCGGFLFCGLGFFLFCFCVFFLMCLYHSVVTSACGISGSKTCSAVLNLFEGFCELILD